jgi:hypothetical protein
MSGVKFSKGYGKWFLEFYRSEGDGRDERDTSRTLDDRERATDNRVV